MTSNIREFYTGKSVFITGATGYLGKVLVEKLVRSCDGIDRIYILIRHKKGMSAEERSKQFISDPIFGFNGLRDTGICNKIEPIFGDSSLPGLGISCEDRELLTEKVNVVMHLAASVNMNASLRSAIESNLKPIKTLIDLCHQIKRLDCLVYASTIALLSRTTITKEEVLQSINFTPDQVINACDNCSDKELKKIRKTLFSEFNNTYCISKALAEQLLARESHRLNIAIVRPSIVTPAYKDPIPGWVLPSLNQTSINMLLLTSLGIMRVFPTDGTPTTYVIPVDYASNALIASAWFVSNAKTPELHVYHLTTNYKTAKTNRYTDRFVVKAAKKFPSRRVVRPPGLIYKRNMFEFYLNSYIKHWLFARMVQMMAKLCGTKIRITRITNKMNKFVKDITAFYRTSPEYEINNTSALIDSMCELDRQLFGFDVRLIDLEEYNEIVWLGIRRHILKEKDEDIPRARTHYRRF